jgi:hypothetical protein
MEGELGSISSFCCSSSCKQSDARDVGIDSGELWSIQEGQERCVGIGGVQSSYSAVGENDRGFPFCDFGQRLRGKTVAVEGMASVNEATATSNRGAGLSSPSKGCTMEDEVENFFQQLWHIPCHLAKGCPRVAPIKQACPRGFRVPKPPLPLLPQERSGLCCLC